MHQDTVSFPTVRGRAKNFNMIDVFLPKIYSDLILF